MMQVVALVPGGIGDQLLFFPTIATLKQTYPQAAIDVVVEPRSVGAYRICPHVNKVISFDFKDSNSLADWGNLLGVLRDREYDAILSLGRRWTVGFLLWLTGIPQRISFAGPGNLFLTQAIPLNDRQYAAATYWDLLRGFGIEGTCPPIRIEVPQSDVAWAKSALATLKLDSSGFILLHGGSSTLAKLKGIDKVYPAPQWAVVLQGIRDRLPDIPTVLLEGPEDRAFASELRAAFPSLLSLSPPDVGKMAATIAAANLLLCTDSGPMHVGVATETPLVALFGPTDPAKLLPADSKRAKYVKAPNSQAIAAISPTEILAKIWEA